MAKDPFQQLRVLTNATKKGNKLTDCYRLLYKKELWQAPKELNPPLSNLVDQTILQLQNGSFRFGQCDQNSNEHEVLLVTVIYKILTHAYPSCLLRPPSLHETLCTVQNEWHEVQWCLVGRINPNLTPKYILPAMEKRILDKRFLLLIHQLLKSKILDKGKRSDRLLFLKVLELLEGILWSEWDCFIAGQMKQVGLANTSKEVKGLNLVYARFKREIIIGLCGSKLEVLHFNKNIREFIESHMSYHYDLRVKHVQNRVDFAGYQIRRKKLTQHLTLNPSTNVLVQMSKKNGYGCYIEFLPQHRSQLLHLSEGQIMSIYNAELRRLATYFSLAECSHKLSKLYHLARASFLMTLACKSNTTVTKTAKRVKKYKQGKIIVFNDRSKPISFIDLSEFLSK